MNDEDKKAMSVSEAGAKGGETTKRRYGHEFYENIGRKGGAKTKAKYGPEYFQVIGQKGGRKSKRRD